MWQKKGPLDNADDSDVEDEDRDFDDDQAEDVNLNRTGEIFDLDKNHPSESC